MDRIATKLAVLVGPTASGKTAVSLRLAALLKAEILSGDSMQVYRGLDIGTAKIAPAQRGGIRHHLLDIRDPGEDFSVADFRLAAAQAIQEIAARGHLPLLVGGTGLYIASLVKPYLFPAHTGRDEAFRARLLQLAQEKGDAYLHEQLATLDATAASRIHPHDHYRVVRALEVYQQSGRTISELQEQSRTQHQPAYRAAIAGLYLRRELLYPRIEQRVEEMMEQGLLEEVKGLLQADIPEDATALRGLGYRHLAAYLHGLSTLPEAVAALKRDTRRFAKRQYTWFKRDESIRWFDVEDYWEGNHYPHTERLAQDIAAWYRRELEEVVR